MTLFIQITDFKKIAQCQFENFYASYIDFDKQEWQFIQRPNEESEKKSDVEISYLFQFDRIELIESSIVTMLRFFIMAWMKRLFKTIF